MVTNHGVGVLNLFYLSLWE
ncbi:hypothetical protein Goari_024700 [Gossypium aridum]|uniref:Uncharacterized protein n=1 Tax=Gossypium aridum TaxID=34290 RepID=A0A7J8X6X7_GOSAI|nr:hypothetical protein [Gossypium aridum]